MTDLSEETLWLDDIQVRVIRSDRRRTLTLEIDHDGIKARAPRRMRANTILDFVNSKRSWIKKHLGNLPARPAPVKLASGAELRLLGNPVWLRVDLHTTGRVRLLDSELVVPVKPSHLPVEQSIRNKLLKWYRAEATDLLQQKVMQLTPVILGSEHRNTPLVKVRDYKRRWGSCNHQGELFFNWRIVMAPESVVDYVVTHEIAHLVVFNHSRRFWRLVERHMPDWRAQQDWLTAEGATLYIV